MRMVSGSPRRGVRGRAGGGYALPIDLNAQFGSPIEAFHRKKHVYKRQIGGAGILDAELRKNVDFRALGGCELNVARFFGDAISGREWNGTSAGDQHKRECQGGGDARGPRRVISLQDRMILPASSRPENKRIG